MEQQIPKVIHYCWFGGKPLPEEALRCIESWREIMPDYEIKRWDESNFDVRSCLFASQAYDAEKYAFVSDFARFWILYRFGGIYFDTDVEVIKSFDDIIEKGPFLGCERHAVKGSPPQALNVAPGLGMGCYPNHPFIKEMLDFYSDTLFLTPSGKHNLTTVVKYTTEALVKRGLHNTSDIQCVDGIYIYPKEYFCPLDVGTKELTLTDRTYSIHYYSGSWMGFSKTLKDIAKRILGKPLSKCVVRFKRYLGK